MRALARLRMLIDEGLSDGVVRRLMNGKEATVYVVSSDGETHCAMVCKDTSECNCLSMGAYLCRCLVPLIGLRLRRDASKLPAAAVG